MSITSENQLAIGAWLTETKTRPETLAHLAGVGLATVQRARNGRRLALKTAEAISVATGGAVSTMTLLRGSDVQESGGGTGRPRG